MGDRANESKAVSETDAEGTSHEAVSDEPAPEGSATGTAPMPPAPVLEEPASDSSATDSSAERTGSGQDTATDKGKLPQPTSGSKSIAALVCGILALVFAPTIILGIALGVIALVLGIRSRKQTPDRKATAGIACGIIGVVISVFLLVVVLAVVQVATDATSTGTLDSYVSEMQNATGSEDDEDSARQAADEALGSATQPSDERKSQAADAIDAEFSQSFGASLSDAGVDADDIVNWMVDGASYSIDNVTVTGGTATAKVTLTVRDFDALRSAVNQQVSDYLELNGGNGATSTAQIAQQVGRYVTDAMAQTATTTETEYLIINKDNGAWAVDQSSIDGVTSDVLGSY